MHGNALGREQIGDAGEERTGHWSPGAMRENEMRSGIRVSRCDPLAQPGHLGTPVFQLFLLFRHFGPYGQ
jgi:hypothetical protein